MDSEEKVKLWFNYLLNAESHLENSRWHMVAYGSAFTAFFIASLFGILQFYDGKLYQFLFIILVIIFYIGLTVKIGKLHDVYADARDNTQKILLAIIREELKKPEEIEYWLNVLQIDYDKKLEKV